MNNICIIPARGGSKRIKNKNIKLFNGKPIIYWSIKAAQESGCFSKIIVSTDSKKISKIVNRYGNFAETLRPKFISKDNTPVQAVLEYEIKKILKNEKIDYVCCLLATFALVDPKDLIKSINIIKKKNFKFVFSSTAFEFPIQRHFFLNKKNIMIKKKFTGLKLKTQSLKKAFHDAGQFYWANAKTFCSSKLNIYNSKSFAYILPSFKYIDIDDIDDWKKSEAMVKVFKLIKQ